MAVKTRLLCLLSAFPDLRGLLVPKETKGISAILVLQDLPVLPVFKVSLDLRDFPVIPVPEVFPEP